MELVRLTLQNFKIHKETVVEFDSALNVIGGSNETGKSTIVDAISRALFLKAKGSNELINELKSKIHSGDPSTEIVFKSKEITYTLQKTFSSKGTAKLTWPGSKIYQDDEAYTELAKILGTDLGFSPSASNLASKWEHLIARQGDAGNNPIGLLQNNYDQLSKKIAEDGGAVFIQTAKDMEVSNYFSSQYGLCYTQTGKVAANSKLDYAAKQQSTAQQNFDSASQIVKDLEEAKELYEKTKQQIVEIQSQIDESEEELRNLLAEEQKLNDIKKNQEELESRISQKEKDLVQLKADNEEILEELENKVEAEKNRKGLKDQLLDLSNSKTSLEKEISKLTEEISELSLDFLNGKALFLKAVEEKIKSEQNLDQIKSRIIIRDTLHKKEKELEKSLNKLYSFSDKEFNEFRKLESSFEAQKAVLAAISTSVKVVKSNSKIELNNEKVKTGFEFNFTENFQISFDAENILEIIPGGGEGLSNAKECFGTFEKLLAEVYKKTGTKSSEEYYKGLDGLKNLQRDLQTTQNELAKPEYDNLEAVKNAAEVELENALSKIKENEKQFSVDQSNVAQEIKECEKAIADARLVESEKVGLKETKEKAQDAIDEQIKDLNLKITDLNIEIKGLETSVNVKEERIGSEKDRLQKINLITEEIKKLSNDLDEIIEKLSELDADSKLKKIKLLGESIPKKREKIQELTTEKGRLSGKLEVNGEKDPFSAQLIAQEELNIANENLKSQNNYAQAIDLLNDKFKKIKDQLADAITQPLADIANIYMKEVLGNQVQLKIVRNEGKLDGLKLVKPENKGGLLDFQTLSGGTKEQVASALRLALAEVLARDFEGKLPIVFDDSFVNSDDERTKGLNQMIYLAAERGLQVILLSCHPKAFKDLPAEQTIL